MVSLDLAPDDLREVMGAPARRLTNLFAAAEAIRDEDLVVAGLAYGRQQHALADIE